jgi:hypothetical protein
MGTDKVVKTAEEPVVVKKGRKDRVPLGVLRTKLRADQREGFVRRWINDKPGRLDDAANSGYNFVTDPDSEMKIGDGNDVSQIAGIGTVVSRIVGVHEDGRPMRSYLMEIEKDLYDGDQVEKMTALNEREDGIRRGQDDQGRPGKDGRYVPATGIKIDHGSMS